MTRGARARPPVFGLILYCSPSFKIDLIKKSGKDQKIFAHRQFDFLNINIIHNFELDFQEISL